MLEFAPVNWKQILEQQDTQQRLDANPFRTASSLSTAPIPARSSALPLWCQPRGSSNEYR